MATTLDDFIANCINTAVELGGTLVSEAEYERRVLICEGCEFHKNVSVAGFEMKGCSICKCPTATKPRYEKYFSLKKLKIVKAVCPHKQGDKWHT